MTYSIEHNDDTGEWVATADHNTRTFSTQAEALVWLSKQIKND